VGCGGEWGGEGVREGGGGGGGKKRAGEGGGRGRGNKNKKPLYWEINVATTPKKQYTTVPKLG